MEILGPQFQIFTLVFARFLALFSVAPGYSGDSLPFFSRFALAFISAAIITPVADMPDSLVRDLERAYILIVLEQAVIGLFIGIAMQFLFAAYQLAGEFFSVQMGFGISEVLDPMSQVSMPVIGTLKNLVALFVFFVSGAHTYLVQALAFSVERVPHLGFSFLKQGVLQNQLFKYFALLSGGMFIAALKIALPVIGCLLLVSVTLGIMSKAAPQMNMLVLGFSIKIVVGFVVLAILAPLIVQTMFAEMDRSVSMLDAMIKAWR
ncbi:flagellar biosynthetic protein FliR [Turneriella parva]|uniref:Flagellar biosynthetic protein FliR n=1 Tax=Turneriella parva (strain ATCC BAA-1111 / DSM 21527 / NCTC 11395 / H) TaxID=869212 RepID=U3GJK2_TURPD|nr:flagellar biosynthetic protein FliR [Turneriella parva]AFM14287.1 flagellar biosynthetic protein FliR [Turneriella parva DSM 21527]